MKEAAPRPVLGRGAESCANGIAMDVTKLLHALTFAVDIEIVIASLPEPAILLRKSAGDALLQGLDSFGE